MQPIATLDITEWSLCLLVTSEHCKSWTDHDVLIADLGGASRAPSDSWTLVPQQDTTPLGSVRHTAPIRDSFVQFTNLKLTTMSFVDNTIDLQWRNFRKVQSWDKVPEGSTIILGTDEQTDSCDNHIYCASIAHSVMWYKNVLVISLHTFRYFTVWYVYLILHGTV